MLCTSVAFDLAARISGGLAWPDAEQQDPGEEANSQPPQACLLICLQDSTSDTLGRRLQQAGGDPNRLLHFSQFMTMLSAKQFLDRRQIPVDLFGRGVPVDRRADTAVVAVGVNPAFDQVPFDILGGGA